MSTKQTNQRKDSKDILPEGHEDPMLMTIEELQRAITKAKEMGAKWAVFLEGVLFARVSLIASGVPLAR